MLGWKKHKLESRLLGEISITSDIQMTPPLWHKTRKVGFRIYFGDRAVELIEELDEEEKGDEDFN